MTADREIDTRTSESRRDERRKRKRTEKDWMPRMISRNRTRTNGEGKESWKHKETRLQDLFFPRMACVDGERRGDVMQGWWVEKMQGNTASKAKTLGGGGTVDVEGGPRRRTGASRRERSGAQKAGGREWMPSTSCQALVQWKEWKKQDQEHPEGTTCELCESSAPSLRRITPLPRKFYGGLRSLRSMPDLRAREAREGRHAAWAVRVCVSCASHERESKACTERGRRGRGSTRKPGPRVLPVSLPLARIGTVKGTVNKERANACDFSFFLTLSLRLLVYCLAVALSPAADMKAHGSIAPASNVTKMLLLFSFFSSCVLPAIFDRVRSIYKRYKQLPLFWPVMHQPATANRQVVRTYKYVVPRR